MTLRHIYRFARDTRLGAALVSLAAVLAFSSVPIYLAQDYGNDHRRVLAVEAERHARNRIAQANALFNRAKSIPGIVALTVSQAGTPSRFEMTIRSILNMSGIVESVSIASTYGPATVVHRDLGEQTEAVKVLFRPAAALATAQRPVIAFGEGTLLIRETLTEGQRERGRFWGYLTAVASLSDLIQELQLLALVNEGFGVHFRVQWQSGTAETVIFSGGNAADEGATHFIPLAGNARLALTVSPPRVPLIGLQPISVAGLLMVDVLLFLLAFHLLRRPQLLAREVEARTREIAAEKVALRKEIAARIAAEDYLERSHGLLDSIFEHIPGMIVLKRVSDMRIARINSSGERMLGRSRDLLYGRCNDEIYAPDLAEMLTQADVQAVDQEGLVRLAVQRVEMPAATPRWIAYSMTTLRNREGVAQYILEFGEDVTEREDLQRRLEDQLRFLEQLIEAFPGPVFSKDVGGRYLAVNTQFEEFVGRPRTDLIGKTAFDIAPENLAQEYDQADRALMEAGGKQVYESKVKIADGGIVETMFHKAVFHASDGSKAGIVGIALDISARKDAERRVESLNRVLRVLSEINHLIIYTHAPLSLLEDARRILQGRGGFPVVWIHARIGGEMRIIADAAMQGYAERILAEIQNPQRRCWPERRLHCQTVHCCNAALGAELEQLGLQSLIHLPLRYGETEWGDIGILGAAGQAFTAEERALLDELAGNLAFALDAMHQEELRVAAESKLALSARVFENNSEGIVITDAGRRIVMVNNAFTAVTGYASAEVIGRTPALFGSRRHPAVFFRRLWQTLRRDGEWRGEVVSRRKNGEDFPGWLTVSQVRNDLGVVTNYVAVFSDLSARRQIEARLDFLAHFDALTALPNREHFNRRLAQALDDAKTGERRVAVICFDLDRFKLVNETLGNVAGDQLLVEVSRRLLTTVESKLDVARLGGDQFAVLVPDLDSVDQATQAVARIQEMLRKPFLQFAAQEIHISASIGVSMFPEDGDEAEVLGQNADSAMYTAGEEGGNTYRFFRQEMNVRAAERVQVESRLHHALERGEFSVHFQPFVAADNGRIVGAEALLRWNSRDAGSGVSPAVFIPLLEEIGLIRQVGQWVLRQACAEVKRWHAYSSDRLFVAVNISALQLTDELPQLVAAAIADSGISPAQLEIELTESAIMRDAEHGISLLHQLKSLGVKLSIDDFGTGYSSLAYLKRLPISTLKIDRSFVRDLPGDSEAASIARAILALGQSLHLDIIGEGVETRDQVEFLCHNGCDVLQGYYFSKSLSAEKFRLLLAESVDYSLPNTGQPRLQLLTGTRPRD